MTVVLWDPQTLVRTKVRFSKDIQEGITSIAFAPNNSMLASASYDGTIRLMEYKNWQADTYTK